ncbi:MAG: WYL domain-containing protein [Oscillospiraceae bacterium]|nr:WYL domain-containing protein [Oscillospiraceae bacterium]
MKLFSEIYGAYFRCTEAILSEGKLSEKRLREIVSEKAFRDSQLFIPEKLIPDKSGNSPWGLLKRDEKGRLCSVLEQSPPRIITALQKSRIKAMLSDPRIRLFLSDEDISALSERLKDVKPLYNREYFREFDRFTDGDDYEDPHYREVFGIILKAVREREILTIELVSRRGIRMTKNVLPVKIEYSRKNDKFRVYCITAPQKEEYLFNICRIERAMPTGKHESFAPDMEEFFSRRRCEKPVTVEVSSERNAVERFMMEFAAYEKRSELDLETGKCHASIYYDKQDETELLIMLLGFGPVLKITGPEEFLEKARERVERQYELFYPKGEDIAAEGEQATV